MILLVSDIAGQRRVFVARTSFVLEFAILANCIGGHDKSARATVKKLTSATAIRGQMV
jgi:hypothetical protein